GQITANYHGTLQGALSFRAEGGVGNDRIVATLNPAAGSGSDGAASIYARVLGDSGNDDLRLFVMRPSSLPRDAIDAEINGGLGRDTFRRTPNVRVRNAERWQREALVGVGRVGNRCHEIGAGLLRL